MDSRKTSARSGATTRQRRLAIILVGALVLSLIGSLAVAVIAGGGSNGDVEKLNNNAPIEQADPSDIDASGILLADLEKVGQDQPVALASLVDDRPMLVNVWASFCAPCIEEMPWLEAVSTSEKRVQIVGVSADPVAGRAEAMARRTKITYPWFRDGAGEVQAAGATVGLPDTFLISPDGRVLASHRGVFKSEQDIRNWIDEHLA